MDYARDVIEDGADHIDPELGGQPHLEKDSERREDDGGNYSSGAGKQSELPLELSILSGELSVHPDWKLRDDRDEARRRVRNAARYQLVKRVRRQVLPVELVRAADVNIAAQQHDALMWICELMRMDAPEHRSRSRHSGQWMDEPDGRMVPPDHADYGRSSK